MSAQLTIPKGAQFAATIDLGEDLTGRTFRCQIRTEREIDSQLIVEPTVGVEGSPSDGILSLTITAQGTRSITRATGWLGLIETTTASQPRAVFDTPIAVVFIGVVVNGFE